MSTSTDPSEVSAAHAEEPHYHPGVEAAATRAAATVFVVAGLLALLMLWGTRRPLSGEGSLGQLAAWISSVAGAGAFLSSFLLASRRGVAAWRRRIPRAKRILDAAAMTLAVGSLAYFSVLATAHVFQLGFIGLTVDPLGGAVIVGAAVAAVSYVALLAGSKVTGEGVALLATLVLAVGTLASMLSTPDPEWWKLHFSQLGNVAELSGYRFNLALILAGAVLTVLAGFVGHDIERGLAARGAASPRRVALLTWLFAGMGIGLSIAGFVPDAVSFVIHVGAASGMVVVYIVFVFFAIRLPGLPREISILSLLVIAGIVVAALLWTPLGYYNLTGMEFVAASLLFGWLTLFVRAIGAYAHSS